MSEPGAYDVIVIGSGGPGLVAALRARDRGRRVAVLEKTDRIGGTTAVSGGMLWVPGNHHMRELGILDSRDEALRYLRRVAGGQSTEDLLQTFVDRAPEMARYLEARTPIRLTPLARPDYHPEWEGGKPAGRTLDHEPFDAAVLGAYRDRVRRGPHYPPLTYSERHRWVSPEDFDWELIARRLDAGILTLGGALVGGLLKACLEAGVEIVLDTAAAALSRGPRGVSAVTATARDGTEVVFTAARAVIVASGGFEWQPHMKRHFLRGPELASATPPSNTGEGILMAMAVGAALGNMNEAAWFPVIRIPGEEYDGHPVARLIVDERCKPGSIIVNRQGRRFVNEAMNYNDIIRRFHDFDPAAYDHPNLPAHLVFDERFRSRYNVATALPSDAPPAWFKTGPGLDELAAAAGIDPAGLRATIARFNGHAVRGVDPDFRRGQSAHDRYYGDAGHEPNPSLGPLDTPPYFAVEILPGSGGTKGGLLCDAAGRVQDAQGHPIPRLYACGNAAAHSMGMGYPGAGGMLGPSMTFGYIAGDSAGAEPA